MLRAHAVGLAAACLAAVSLAPAGADAAGMLIAEGGFGGELRIEDHDVRVTINNGVAVTEVEQVFYNTEQRVVEALYVFPVPEGASVANFSMWIDGREMVGEVVEKERARRVYESYKATRVDPGLLEQRDAKTFEMRIFPIAANAQQRVRISYYQELDFDADRATYVYPLASRAAAKGGSNVAGRFSLAMRVLSEAPLAALESPSHGDRVAVVRNSPFFYEASYETRNADLSRDVVLAVTAEKAVTGFDLITSQPPGEDGYFQLTLSAGDELGEQLGGADYVFVLDVSGSMGHGRKLGLSRDSIASFLATLSPEDRFEMMTFNTRPDTLFDRLRPANESTRVEALSFLDSQRTSGGTELRHAIRTAYKYGDADRPLNVVVLSDGMTEQRGRTELLRLLRERPVQATVFAVGVGNEVDRPLLAQVAGDAGGLAAFLSPSDDFEAQAKAFRRKLTRPAARDVRVHIGGVEAYDVTTSVTPNLYHGSPVRMYGRYRGTGPFDVRVDAVVQGQKYQQAQTLEAGDGKNPEIERMWAQRRIEALLREADRNGSRSAAIDKVVALGEAYSIATEYTSFIVLENDAEYRRWNIDRKNALRLDRDRAAREELEERLERLRERSLANLGPKPPAADAPQPQPKATSETPEPSSALLALIGGGASLLFGRRGRR